MAATTYNFPCWQQVDDLHKDTVDSQYPIGNRDDGGTGFSTGTTHGITTQFTVAFAILARGWNDSPLSHTLIDSYDQEGGDGNNYLLSIGRQAQWADFYCGIHLSATASDNYIFIGSNSASSTPRWVYHLGDEDGSNWVTADKWFQVVVSCTTGGDVDWAVNGTLTPQSTEVETPTGVDFPDLSNRRLWLHAPLASANYTDLQTVLTTPWPSAVVGPVMVHNVALDLTDSAVLGRFYDSNGDFKNPGENGSLWLSSTYGTAPTIFLPGGNPNTDKGGTATWTALASAITNEGGGVGGLRKQYENVSPVTSLTTNLVSWWSMDEASGARADSHGSYNLTDGGTTLDMPSPRARIRQAADFDPGTSDYLVGGSTASAYTPQTGSFTVMTWVSFDDIDADNGEVVLGVFGTTSQISWAIRSYNAANQASGAQGVEFQVTSDGSTIVRAAPSVTLANDTDVWYMLLAEYDATNNQITLTVNNSTTASHTATTAFTGPVFDAAVPLTVGASYDSGSGANFQNCQVDETAFWTRLLTDEEKAWLWNDEGGRGYPG